MKNTLYKRIDYIKDPRIQNFVKEALDHADPEFWKAPCSSSGLHHPPEDQGKEGLIRHLIKCAELSKDLCDYHNLNNLDTDIAIAGTMLHDIKKNGEPWGEKTDYTHGVIGFNYLEQFPLEETGKKNIKLRIQQAVKYHMGTFTQPEELQKAATNPTKIQSIVQMADFFCSRNYASWLPGIQVSKEDIKNFK